MDAIPLVHGRSGEHESAVGAEMFSAGWPVVWSVVQGARGKALEAELVERNGVRGAVAVRSCGDARYLAMRTLDVEPGAR